MTTNKVCGKGKCKFTDEFCASGDCPYDTENVANNVAQRNSQDLERVADTSKTIVVEKEVYEAVLRNSVKVADLEAENYKLKSLLHSCRNILEDEGWHLTVKQIDEVLK
jgi:hypothetical protein